MGCLSTHGGAGYTIGDYWDGDAIICSLCGARIENPNPTGERFVLGKSLMDRLFGRGTWISTYPPFIKGAKGRYI